MPRRPSPPPRAALVARSYRWTEKDRAAIERLSRELCPTSPLSEVDTLRQAVHLTLQRIEFFGRP
jgi:hypothetical protein